MKFLYISLLLSSIFQYSFAQSTFSLHLSNPDSKSYKPMDVIETDDNFLLSYKAESDIKKSYNLMTLSKSGEVIDNTESSDPFSLAFSDRLYKSTLCNVAHDFSSFSIVLQELSIDLDTINSRTYTYTVTNNDNIRAIGNRITSVSDNELILQIGLVDSSVLANNQLILAKVSTQLDITAEQYFGPEFNFLIWDIDKYPANSGYLMTTWDEYTEPVIIELDSELNYEEEFYPNGNWMPLYHGKSYIKFLSDSTFLYSAKKTMNGTTIRDKIELSIIDTSYNRIDSVLTGEDYLRHSEVQKNGLDYIYTDAIYWGGSEDIMISEYPHTLAIAKVNSSLEKEWEILANLEEPLQISDLKATMDGGCIITISSTLNLYQWSLHIYKIDANGNFPTTNTPEIKFTELLPYPNPGTNQLNIRTAVQATGGTFYLYDMQGRMVLSKTITDTHTQIQTDKLAPGSYIYQYILKGVLRESGKWMKN